MKYTNKSGIMRNFPDDIRNDTAKQYRKIRKILHANYTPETDTEPKGFHWSQWIIIIIGLLTIIYLLVIPGCAQAYTEQDAIKAVIGEAEGESMEGKEAVACAIHYRGYLTGIYGLKAPRVIHHKYSRKTYLEAKQAVEMAEDQEFCEGMVNGAQYWGSLKVDKDWINKMRSMGYIHTATYGNQAFFRKDY